MNYIDNIYGRYIKRSPTTKGIHEIYADWLKMKKDEVETNPLDQSTIISYAQLYSSSIKMIHLEIIDCSGPTYKYYDYEKDIMYIYRNHFMKNYSRETPINAVEFCISSIKGSWKEIENYIFSCPIAAFLYVIFVLEKRWKIVEQMHKHINDNNIIEEYIKIAFGNHFPEDEVKINPLFDSWHEMMLEKITPTNTSDSIPRHIKVLTYFSIETIEYLKRGNRIPNRFRYVGDKDGNIDLYKYEKLRMELENQVYKNMIIPPMYLDTEASISMKKDKK